MQSNISHAEYFSLCRLIYNMQSIENYGEYGELCSMQSVVNCSFFKVKSNALGQVDAT